LKLAAWKQAGDLITCSAKSYMYVHVRTTVEQQSAEICVRTSRAVAEHARVGFEPRKNTTSAQRQQQKVGGEEGPGGTGKDEKAPRKARNGPTRGSKWEPYAKTPGRL